MDDHKLDKGKCTPLLNKESHLFFVVVVHSGLAVARRVEEQVLRLPLVHGSVVIHELGVNAVVDEASLTLPPDVVLAHVLGESPLGAFDNLLSSRKLELGQTQRLLRGNAVHILDADAHHDLSNLHTSARSERLSEGSAHTRLQSICAGARKHLVDAQHVEGVRTHAQVERLLAGVLDHIPVCGNASRLERLGADVHLLPGDEVHAVREGVDSIPLHSCVEDADLRVGNTAAVPRLRVRLIFDDAYKEKKMERGEVSESKAERHNMIITRRTYGSIARDDGPWLLLGFVFCGCRPSEQQRPGTLKKKTTTAASAICPRVSKRGYPFGSRVRLGVRASGLGLGLVG